MRKYIALFIAVIFLVPMIAVGAGSDLAANVKAVRALSPVTVSNNTEQASQIIDRIGYRTVLFIINVATVADTDATFTPALYGCDNNACADNVAATAAERHGALTPFTIADNNAIIAIEYTGTKRYVRLNIVPAANTGAATFGVIAIKGYPQYLPAQ